MKKRSTNVSSQKDLRNLDYFDQIKNHCFVRKGFLIEIYRHQFSKLHYIRFLLEKLKNKYLFSCLSHNKKKQLKIIKLTYYLKT